MKSTVKNDIEKFQIKSLQNSNNNTKKKLYIAVLSPEKLPKNSNRLNNQKNSQKKVFHRKARSCQIDESSSQFASKSRFELTEIPNLDIDINIYKAEINQLDRTRRKCQLKEKKLMDDE